MKHLHLRKNREARKLPEAAQRYLRRQFMLQDDYIEKLRCFEMEGTFREQPVRRLRVFSPALARHKRLTIRTNSDLVLYPEVLVFEGHIDMEDKIYFADRRTTKRKVEEP